MDYIAEKTDFRLANSAVTLGKFDGLHQGHQLLIDTVIEHKKYGYNAVMFSFSFHPYNLFSNKEFELIYTEEEKLTKLQNTSLDVLVSYPFTDETRNTKPLDFIKEILVDKLDAKVIVVGNDFRFGYQRGGDVNMLQEYADTFGYKLIICERCRLNDTIISSTEIRKELKESNIEAVNRMLGQPYSIIGEVRHGRKIGRALGMPTTNIIPASNKLLPPYGVYVSKTIIDGVSYPGLTNIGLNPTVGDNNNKGVETFIFDFDGDLYGKVIEVELYSFLRPELKFNTLEELRLQMRQDILDGREYVSKL